MGAATQRSWPLVRQMRHDKARNTSSVKVYGLIESGGGPDDPKLIIERDCAAMAFAGL